jgi:hypothetical protein
MLHKHENQIHQYWKKQWILGSIKNKEAIANRCGLIKIRSRLGKSEVLTMKKIEVFIQMEGVKDIQLVEVVENGTVRDLLLLVAKHGKQCDNDEIPSLVFIEDMDDVLDGDKLLENVGVRHRTHVHIHRCRHIEVIVNFNGKKISKNFPPSATVGRVKKWAAKEFGMSEKDASEHVLQISGTKNSLDEDIHIGTLTKHPVCHISFDLVPKVRIEG